MPLKKCATSVALKTIIEGGIRKLVVPCSCNDIKAALGYSAGILTGEIQADISGLTNAFCTGCASINGTFIFSGLVYGTGAGTCTVSENDLPLAVINSPTLPSTQMFAQIALGCPGVLWFRIYNNRTDNRIYGFYFPGAIGLGGAIGDQGLATNAIKRLCAGETVTFPELRNLMTACDNAGGSIDVKFL